MNKNKYDTAEILKSAPEEPGKIDAVRKVLSGIGSVLMLLSLLFPFLRMTYPNGEVDDMTRKETFAIGMEGWDAGPYIIWGLILLSCALILFFQMKNQRKKSRHGCRIALLIVIFDILTIAGFIAQYGTYEITFLPLAGFWFLAAGWLITWIASFLHKRKKKPAKRKKNRRGSRGPENSEDGNPEIENSEDENDRNGSSKRSGKKLYREMKKQQKLEREERMIKTAERRENEHE